MRPMVEVSQPGRVRWRNAVSTSRRWPGAATSARTCRPAPPPPPSPEPASRRASGSGRPGGASATRPPGSVERRISETSRPRAASRTAATGSRSPISPDAVHALLGQLALESGEALLGGGPRGVLVPGHPAARRRRRRDDDVEVAVAGRDPARHRGGEGLARQGLIGDDEDRAHRDTSVARAAIARIVNPASTGTDGWPERFRSARSTNGCSHVMIIGPQRRPPVEPNPLPRRPGHRTTSAPGSRFEPWSGTSRPQRRDERQGVRTAGARETREPARNRTRT